MSGKESQKTECSRTCNTGAQNTYQNVLRACVDWVSVTFKNVEKPQEVCDILGIDYDRFSECEFGDKGYKEQLRLGHISILYNGQANMGIHLNMTGQGCREFEQETSKSWSQFFALLFAFDVNFSRLDIAIDDFDGYLKLDTLKRRLRDGAVRSKFKNAMEIRKTEISDGSSKGYTIYFGSAKSRLQVRFYDKLLERIEKGQEVEESVTHWVRSEIQLKDERAQATAKILAFEMDDIGAVVKGILSNYITFLVKGKDSNKSRWAVAPFWTKFLGDVDKLGLTEVAPDRTIQRSYNWVENQVNTTFAMLYEAFNHDEELIQNMLEDGYSKLKKEHVDIINRFKSENGQETIDFEEFKVKREANLKRVALLKAQKKETSLREVSACKEI